MLGDSVTWEVACGCVVPWIRQRTRWIKGYVITAGVDTRQVVGPLRETGVRGLITLATLILGAPIAFLAYPALLLLCALQVGGFRAAGQTVRSPHRWEKTPHGLTGEAGSSAPGSMVVSRIRPPSGEDQAG